MNTVFSNQFGISVFPKRWLMHDELYGATFCFFMVVILHLKTGPHLLQLLRRTLQCCFASGSPEMIYRLRNFTWLSISFRVSGYCLHFWGKLILTRSLNDHCVKKKKEEEEEAQPHVSVEVGQQRGKVQMQTVGALHWKLPFSKSFVHVFTMTFTTTEHTDE